jgi:hypothetical protein
MHTLQVEVEDVAIAIVTIAMEEVQSNGTCNALFSREMLGMLTHAKNLQVSFHAKC